MDYRRENGFSSGNVVQVLSGNSGNAVNESWGAGYADQAVWATEDDYGMWNAEASLDNNSNSNYDGRVSRSGSEPPNKRSRNSQSGDLAASNRSKAIGKMFYKTKLCCKFRAGTCPYITNCNFAHSIEELRNHHLIGKKSWLLMRKNEQYRLNQGEFQIPILGSVTTHRGLTRGALQKVLY
ncbi:UNVERIFIED_CONTAM: Zinc finger CCCH domain-containing protein 12 [Sesamum radiatum]|uniref:Zinc finger CCCH domain-containing protein 12 n=1 Tax=Sesamum radiatum TaxID=300843 RepID=A0AAW2VIT1_SESRA